jgi:hypothetical protein
MASISKSRLARVRLTRLGLLIVVDPDGPSDARILCTRPNLDSTRFVIFNLQGSTVYTPFKIHARSSPLIVIPKPYIYACNISPQCDTWYILKALRTRRHFETTEAAASPTESAASYVVNSATNPIKDETTYIDGIDGQRIPDFFFTSDRLPLPRMSGRNLSNARYALTLNRV